MSKLGERKQRENDAEELVALRAEVESLRAKLAEAQDMVAQYFARIERGNEIAQRREAELERERDEARAASRPAAAVRRNIETLLADGTVRLEHIIHVDAQRRCWTPADVLADERKLGELGDAAIRAWLMRSVPEKAEPANNLASFLDDGDMSLLP